MEGFGRMKHIGSRACIVQVFGVNRASKGSSVSFAGPGAEGVPLGDPDSAGFTPAAFLRASSCASNLALCSTGSVSSEKALASSLPAEQLPLDQRPRADAFLYV